MPLWSKARLESRTQDPENPEKRLYKVFDRIEDTRAEGTKTGMDWVGDHESHSTKPIDSSIEKSWHQKRKPRRTLRKTCSRPLSPCFLLHDLDQFFDCWYVSALLNWYILHHFFTMAFLGSPSWPRKPATPAWIWPILEFCMRRCTPWIFASGHTCPLWELLFQAVIKNLGKNYHRCIEILKESDPQTCEVVFKSCYLSLGLWGWMTWSSRVTHFLKCMLTWTPSTNNWRIVLPSCQRIEHCGTSAANMLLPAGSGEERQGRGYHGAVARSAFSPYMPVCCVFFSWSKISVQQFDLIKRYQSWKAQSGREVEPQEKGKGKKGNCQGWRYDGSECRWCPPKYLDEEIEEDVEKYRSSRRNTKGANMFESTQAFVQKWTQLWVGSVHQTVSHFWCQLCHSCSLDRLWPSGKNVPRRKNCKMAVQCKLLQFLIFGCRCSVRCPSASDNVLAVKTSFESYNTVWYLILNP